jgi:hypothetical protein
MTPGRSGEQDYQEGAKGFRKDYKAQRGMMQVLVLWLHHSRRGEEIALRTEDSLGDL